MQQKEIVSLLRAKFKEFGYIKQAGIWFKKMECFDLIFETQFSKWDKSFSIKVGVWFFSIDDTRSKVAVNSCHLNHDLINILMQLGFKYDDLKRLFIFEGLTETQVKNNIDKIFLIMQQKIAPYFKQMDNYTYLYSHFEDDIAFKPFFVLYHDVSFYVNFFRLQSVNVSD